mgnify:CR=1 FL=1
MRVYGPNGTALAAAPSTARRASGGAFTVTEDGAPRSSNSAGSLRAISTIDAPSNPARANTSVAASTIAWTRSRPLA